MIYREDRLVHALATFKFWMKPLNKDFSTWNAVYAVYEYIYYIVNYSGYSYFFIYYIYTSYDLKVF